MMSSGKGGAVAIAMLSRRHNPAWRLQRVSPRKRKFAKRPQVGPSIIQCAMPKPSARAAAPFRLVVSTRRKNPPKSPRNGGFLGLWRELSVRIYPLALLWQIFRNGFGDEFVTVRASAGWWPYEEVENGLPDGRHGRLWRRSPDSFFSAPLL